MFSIGLILLCIFTIHKCNAEEDKDPLFSANNDLLDPSIFSPDTPWLLDPGVLEKDITLQTGYSSTDLPSTFALLNDDASDDELAGGSLPMFADGTEAGCSSETGQLTNTNALSRRGAVNNVCDNPNQDGSSSSSGSSALNAPSSINPKVLPYIDVGTMELKMICPRTDAIPFSLAVCSSGVRGDIIMRPPKTSYELNWAQKIFTVTDLLTCLTPRYIFCCQVFRDDVYKTALGAWIGDRGQAYACELLDPYDYFYVQDQIKVEY